MKNVFQVYIGNYFLTYFNDSINILIKINMILICVKTIIKNYLKGNITIISSQTNKYLFKILNLQLVNKSGTVPNIYS